MQDREAAGQPHQPLPRHRSLVWHGLCAPKPQLPQGGSGCIAFGSQRFCQRWAATDEESHDGQCATAAQGQVHRLGQHYNLLLVGIGSCWRVGCFAVLSSHVAKYYPKPNYLSCVGC